MKKIVTLSGIIAFLVIALVFSACSAVTAWWSGPWIWGAVVLLSDGQTVQSSDAFDPEGTINLNGTSQRPTGVFVDENGNQLVMSQIDLTKEGFITFVVGEEQKEGFFDVENGRIIEQ